MTEKEKNMRNLKRFFTVEEIGNLDLLGDPRSQILDRQAMELVKLQGECYRRISVTFAYGDKILDTSVYEPVDTHRQVVYDLDVRGKAVTYEMEVNTFNRPSYVAVIVSD